MMLEETVTTRPAYANVAGNHYDKYGSGNPIARRLMRSFLACFDRLAARTKARTAYEIGCGEGHLSLRLLEAGIAVRGSDLEASVVAEANRRVQAAGFEPAFTTRDLHALTPAEAKADLLVCCEVLEHLPDPETAVGVLARLAQGHLLASVPREPLWRLLNMARGSYLADLGNTPGHLQHWSSKGFVALLSRRFEILEVAQPLPWTMVLARPRPMPRA
jgi:2-polyprenyl-3-methyl-5-hydroxy-6-metoxy-1,4-benzoquinol methylase